MGGEAELRLIAGSIVTATCLVSEIKESSWLSIFPFGNQAIKKQRHCAYSER